MSEDHAGFIIHVKNPTRDPHRFVACLSITPKTRDRVTDVASKVERNIGAKKAIQLAADFIARCGASEELIAQVLALAPATSDPEDGD